MATALDRRWATPLAVACTITAYLALARTAGGLFTLAAMPAIAGIAVVADLTRPTAMWYGRTPTLVWLARGRVALLGRACGPPLAVSLMATLASGAVLPLAALPALLLYLAAVQLLIGGATLLRGDPGQGAATGIALLILLYGAPLAVLAVAELFPHPEQAAAGLVHADLMRLPWFYSNLPVAYYPYAYPAAWLAAACLALPTLLSLTFSWLRRTPPTGWSQPLWRPR
jgi:hypothetical protein